jgi:hypothetical protein
MIDGYRIDATCKMEAVIPLPYASRQQGADTLSGVSGGHSRLARPQVSPWLDRALMWAISYSFSMRRRAQLAKSATNDLRR